MECPVCGAELVWIDYYVVGLTTEKIGDIYRCPVGSGCDDGDCESNTFDAYFHTDKQEDLHEGYPC